VTTTLDDVVKNLRSQFGSDIIMRLDDEPANIKVIPTGSLALDRALGVGGVPCSRITEIYGPEGGGKTTLAQHIVAECQRMGGTAVYIDMEHAVDLKYMAACGVDTKAVLFSQPNTGTEALNVIRKLVASNTVDLIVLDSVAAMTSAAEIDADAGDHFVGIQARMMSQNLKAIVPALGLSKTALVFINQIRMKIGVMYGNPETTPGGRALKFYSSVRIRIAKRNWLGPKTNRHGIQSLAVVKKNKVAPPFQEAEFDIEWGQGISKAGDVLDVGVDVGLIERAGSWYSYQGEKIGNGRNATKEYLNAHPEIMTEIRQQLFAGEQEESDD